MCISSTTTRNHWMTLQWTQKTTYWKAKE